MRTDFTLAPFTSVAPFATTLGNLDGVFDRAVTISYSAGSAGQTLTLRFVIEDNFGVSFGNLTLSAVALAGASVNQPPVLDPIGDRTVRVGQTLTIDVSARDDDGPSPLVLTHSAWAIVPVMLLSGTMTLAVKPWAQRLLAEYKEEQNEQADVVNAPQRDKVETLPDQLFVLAHQFWLDADACLQTGQLSLFLGDGYVVSFHDAPVDSFQAVRQRIRNPRSRLSHRGADYLLYALLDPLAGDNSPG